MRINLAGMCVLRTVLRKLLAAHRIMQRIGFRHPIGMFIR